jgi:hypothetical protein
MMIPARRIKHPLDMTIQGPHDANPRKTSSATKRGDQNLGFTGGGQG